MKLAIVGSREIKDEEKVISSISQFIKDHTHGKLTIISGGASGVDSIAAKYAKHIGLDLVVFEPAYKVDKRIDYDPKYLFARNKQIVQNADKVLAVWDGVSKGTEHAIKYARHLGVPIMVIKV